MRRATDIRKAYRGLGRSDFYDGMITCSTLSGKAVCQAVWSMGREETGRYLDLALSGIPRDFSGKLLEVPVGTGVLTMPVYEGLPKAEITCLDHSPDMMEKA
ncbi:MAG: class I SAM-dependent methyltransferase, partial [Eubacteriales bacterium]|nr:class I SAM-dependent methyltransferase [Eubacteriales bacterium]